MEESPSGGEAFVSRLNSPTIVGWRVVVLRRVEVLQMWVRMEARVRLA